MKKYIIYLRVSTKAQGQSGLGLEAQQNSVRLFLGDTVEPLAEYVEILSGKRDDRPELAKALDHCRRAGATLLCAKLDRLGRRAAHVLGLLDGAGVPVIFADAPNAGALELGVRAVVAQEEGRMISERTKAALVCARARGVKLGGPNGAAPLRKWNAENGNEKAVAGNRLGALKRAEPWRGIVEAMIADGLSLQAMARTLNERGERSVRGGRWTAKSVSRLRARLAA